MKAVEVREELTELDDRTLLLLYRAGETKAFEVLLLRYQRPLFNFFLRSARDRQRAEDLLQELFLRVTEQSHNFREESSFSTWVYTIARNLWIDSNRKFAFRNHVSLDGSATGDPGGPRLIEGVVSQSLGADRNTVSHELRSRIAEVVESLPEDQREVFLLRQLQHLSFREIAIIVNTSENTVKSRMRYALERLQAALAEYEDYAQELQ